MLGDITVASEIFVVCGYTDMRKSIDGLCAIVRDQLHIDPYKRSAIYLFCGKRCDRIKILKPKDWLVETGLGEFLSVVAWNKLYDRCLFEEVEYPNGRNFEDESTTYKVVYKSKCIARTYRKLYYYRQREGSITQNNLSAKVLNQKLLALNEKCDFFIEKKEEDIICYCQAKYSILVISNFDSCGELYGDEEKKNVFYQDVKKRYVTWVKKARKVPLKYKVFIKWFLLKNKKYDKD